jgi:hypothetical protein
VDRRQIRIGQKHGPLQSRDGRYPCGEGVAVIDPHGDLAEDILDAIPRSRINDVCYPDADQEPHTAWLRPGVDRDRITAEDKLYEPLGTSRLIREQSRQRFGRPREVIEKRRQAATP